MTPRLHSTYFALNEKDQYVRLARVLAQSIKLNAPGWDVEIKRELTPKLRSALQSQSHADNSWKLEFWKAAIDATPDGVGIIVLDADTFLTGDPSSIWEHDFDVAYTARRACRFPLNGGVFAARGGPKARAFMAAWLKTDREFLADKELLRPWRELYAGQNQASLGALIHDPKTLAGLGLFVKIAALPCRVFNCEDTEWQNFDPTVTKIVHVKSYLRQCVLGFGSATNDSMKKIVRLWRSVENSLTSTV